MFAFRKMWRDLHCCYLRFEIRPFALLSTTILSLLELHIKHFGVLCRSENNPSNVFLRLGLC